MKETVVLHAGVGVGHLVPMVALAKLFLRHGLAVTIVTVDPAHSSGSSATAISGFISANPAISFHLLPTLPAPPEISHNPFTKVFDRLREGNQNLLDLLVSISKTASLRGVVLDMFCTTVLDVTAKLGIPTYFFYPSAASILAVALYVPRLEKTLANSFKDMGRTLVHIPGLSPIPASDFPPTIEDRASETYKARVANWPKYVNADGVLINTFEELELKALQALRSGQCSDKMPPVVCIGPLITQEDNNSSEARHECLAWLDSQPMQSVVFLCFGSLGAFSPVQIKEVAIGLENSGQRFLWVVKISDDPNKLLESQSEVDLDNVLPEGFLDCTKDRGMVVKSWVPQTQVLQHSSVGGFVSHCGWNSTLEAVTYGVPIICWPLYAEQKLNKVILVEEIKIAVVMDGYDAELVRAEEVETKVRWLMESEGGKALKARMIAVREKAAKVLGKGGSSSQAFAKFLSDLDEFHKKK